MARPKTREELITSNRENFQKLLDQVQDIPREEIHLEGVCETWSVKDILAHLHAWHMLFLTWYQIGMGGENPAMPAPGFSWRETPELNETLYEEYQDEEYEDILQSLNESHREVAEIMEKHTDQELFTKKLYHWTGSTSLGSYMVSATSSHYNWAFDLIREWLKN